MRENRHELKRFIRTPIRCRMVFKFILPLVAFYRKVKIMTDPIQNYQTYEGAKTLHQEALNQYVQALIEKPKSPWTLYLGKIEQASREYLYTFLGRV